MLLVYLSIGEILNKLRVPLKSKGVKLKMSLLGNILKAPQKPINPNVISRGALDRSTLM